MNLGVRARSAALLLLLLSLAVFPSSAAGAAPPAEPEKTFPGEVRLTLPPLIHATPGIEANVYFDTVVLVINPANYVFDVTCDVGFQYDDRWTYVPADGDAGDHPITIEVRDQSNAVIARQRSTIRVARKQPNDAPAAISVLTIGDSHLQKDVYLQHVLELSNADPAMKLTLVGSRGTGNKPPSDELRHEGYNGWTAQSFVTLSGPLARSGQFKWPETGSPFMYADVPGGPKLDFARYCAEFNHGKPVDYFIIQLGGNDIWSATDENIDTTIDKVFEHYDTLIRMVRDHSKETKVGVVMLDPLSRSQHGFRNYRGPRKQTRWQYRRDQHRMVERQIEHFGERERENVYLIPVHLNLDCVNGFPMRSYPVHSRATTQELRVYDGSHMSPEGYRQFGDAIYAWLKVCASSERHSSN